MIDLLSIVFLALASCLLGGILLASLYIRIRRHFPITVNCWFCNTNAKVPYDNWNSFHCPNCLQYNGFTKDGDYNKVIPEQSDEFMNEGSQGFAKHKSSAHNGLCLLCNNNQTIKIQQLADFEPMVEENYNKEIEHFQKQLDKVFKLCSKCDRVLASTIRHQTAWLFGLRLKNKSTTKPHKTLFRKDSFVAMIPHIVSFVLSTTLFSVCFVSNHHKFLSATTKDYVSSQMVAYLDYIGDHVKGGLYYIVLSVFGFLLQIALVIFNEGTSNRLDKTNKVLCWTILLLASLIRPVKAYAVYILACQMFCCMYLSMTSFRGNDRITKPAQNIKLGTIKRNDPSCETSYESDYNNASRFYNKDSSFESFHSNNSNLSSFYTTNNKTAASVIFDSTFTTAPDISFASRQLPTNRFTTIPNMTFPSQLSPNRYLRRNSDLSMSMDKLHVGGLNYTRPVCSPTMPSPTIERPRPLLSPPKLTYLSFDPAPCWGGNNFSRSSSQSSGFGSQNGQSNNYGPFDNNCKPYSFMPYDSYVSKSFSGGSLMGDKSRGRNFDTHSVKSVPF